jgi:hypothetical protein
MLRQSDAFFGSAIYFQAGFSATAKSRRIAAHPE